MLDSFYSGQRDSFEQRQLELNEYVRNTKYETQKDRLRVDFETFLASRSSGPPSLATSSSLLAATPTDVIRFLHYRDQGGRTQVHAFDCLHFGLLGSFDCGCPKHFAAKTIDSYVGQLRAVFNAVGRRGFQNPCDSVDVKGWVRACAKEQARHRVPVRQATPIFSSQLQLLVKEIDLREACLTASDPFMPSRYALLRDRAFFLVQWFAGDRAGDLGRALTKEVVRLEDGSLLFNHTVGKTIRDAAGQLLVIPRILDNPSLCPVLAFDRYVDACRSAGLDLRLGYLFPPTAPPRHDSIRNLPLSITTVNNRLQAYLPDSGLTAHGSRGGCAITLLMLGATPESVKEHCRWASDEVFRHYTKLERVRRLDSTAGVLQSAVSSSEGVSEADSAACLYELLDSGYMQTPAVL